jgi:hypothetical protein
MWNPLKNSVHETRDVVWLHRMYFEKPNTEEEKLEPIVYLESNHVTTTVDVTGDADPEEREGVSDEKDASSESESDGESGFIPVTRASTRERKKLSRYEPETGKTVTWDIGAVHNYYNALLDIVDDDELEVAMDNHIRFGEYANVGAALGGGFENTMELRPMKYDEAINGPDGEAWKVEIENEHARMVKNEVFEVVK